MESALKIADLTVKYGKGKPVLENLSLDVAKGEIFGLLGPNGAGKTTLIKSILSLINIKNGTITIFDKAHDSNAAKKRLGYMPEVANYYWYMTASEILHLFGRLAGLGGKDLEGKIDSTLEIVGLKEQKKSLVKTFSKGMQSRLSIAQAILHDPDMLVLDEPFSGLDPLGRIDMRNVLKKKVSEGKTIFLSSHELSEAELICNTVCIMNKGRVLRRGSIKDLLNEKGEHSLENYFVKIITG